VLLSEPVVFRDPFLGFRFGIKATEEARTMYWPRYFDAPDAACRYYRR
jgi:hypothetical protein